MKTKQLIEKTIKELQGGNYDLELNKNDQEFELILNSDILTDKEVTVKGTYSVENIEIEEETCTQPSSLEFDIEINYLEVIFNNGFEQIINSSIESEIASQIENSYHLQDILELT